MYWPASAGKWADEMDNDSGSVDVTTVFKKHQNILVLASGRGKFWSQIVRAMMEAARSEPLPFDRSEPEWARLYKNPYQVAKYYKIFPRCDSIHCSLPESCMRCLRRIKDWSGIPDRQWSTYGRSRDVGVCTVEPTVEPRRKLFGMQCAIM